MGQKKRRNMKVQVAVLILFTFPDRSAKDNLKLFFSLSVLKLELFSNVQDNSLTIISSLDQLEIKGSYVSNTVSPTLC